MNNNENEHRFDTEAFAVAQARAKSSPIDLTDHDLAQIAIVSKTLEADAREAQRRAQLSKVTSPKTQRTLPYERMAAAVVDTFKPVFDSYKTKIAALENRILELEAQAAAARPAVDHVEP